MDRKQVRFTALQLFARLSRWRVRRPRAQIQRILFIKPDHLGDVLLATPAIQRMRDAFPQAELVVMVGPWSRRMLQDHPAIDRLETCTFPGFERRSAARMLGQLTRVQQVLQPYQILLETAIRIRADRYDLAIIGRDDHWWGALLAYWAGIPRRIGYDVPECRPFLSHVLPWNPAEHVTVQGLALVEAALEADHAMLPLAAARHQWPTRFTATAEEQAWAAHWLQSYQIPPTDRLFVIHPGTGGPTKYWVAERWAQLADQLLAGHPERHLVLTAGPGEEQVAEQIAGMIQQPCQVLQGASIGQLAAVLGRAQVVLGVDSGPLHLAVAMGTATVHLYGPSDHQRFGPWGDPARHVVVRAGVECSPCGVFAACPRGLVQPECMEQLPLALVLRAVQPLL